MALTIKKGTISNLNESVVGMGRNGNYASQHSSAFRIENLPAQLKTGTHNSFSNGDVVTAVGEVKKGVLVIYAIRNDSTGAYDEAQTIVPIIMGICMLILGIPLSLLIVGLPLLFFGIRILYGAWLGHQAKSLLHEN